MSENTHKGIIELPEIMSLFWYSRKKEAEIDIENMEITTYIDSNANTQKFHRVKKYELFAVLRYFVSSLFILMLMNFDITIQNEIGLIAAAVTMILWHKWGNDHRIIFNIGELKLSAYAIMLLSMAMALFFSTIIGLFTHTNTYIGGAAQWSLIAILSYKTVFSFLAEEFQQLRKVYVYKLPNYIPRYFKLPDDQNSQKYARVAKKKIDTKIYLVAAGLAFIGSVGLVYHGVIALKENRAQKVAIEKYNAEQHLADLKLQAEQNGSVQTIIRYEKIKLSPDVEELHRKLNIPVEYKEIKTVTYPWEPGYRGCYTTVIKPLKEENQ